MQIFIIHFIFLFLIQNVIIRNSYFQLQLEAFIAANYTQIEESQAHKIQRETVQQANCVTFLRRRRKMMTASNFGKFAKCCRSPQSILKNVMNCAPNSQIPALKYGREKEDVARQKYLEVMRSTERVVAYTSCGIFTKCDEPFLGATPDGLIYDSQSIPCEGLIEIKCPQSKMFSTILEACQSKSFCCEVVADGNPKLKRKHDYH